MLRVFLRTESDMGMTRIGTSFSFMGYSLVSLEILVVQELVFWLPLRSLRDLKGSD